MQEDDPFAPRGLRTGGKLARPPALSHENPGAGGRGALPRGVAAPTVHHQDFGAPVERAPDGPFDALALV